jgi:uncharacterized protein YkwD
MIVTKYKARHIARKKSKRSSREKTNFILGITLCFVFLLSYMGYSVFYISKNTDYLKTIFIEESHYSADNDYTEIKDVQLLSINKAISVLSLTEDRVLYDIDSQISDSVINAGKEINQQIEKDNNQPAETQSAPPAEEPPPPVSNSVESSLIQMINHIRSTNGLQTLIPNQVLNAIARSRSQDMANRGYFSHYTPEGKNIGMILQENGIMYACFAENLSKASPPSSGSPGSIINLWMGSSLHRANLLNPHFGQLGIGVVDANGRRVVTLVLINR